VQKELNDYIIVDNTLEERYRELNRKSTENNCNLINAFIKIIKEKLGEDITIEYSDIDPDGPYRSITIDIVSNPVINVEIKFVTYDTTSIQYIVNECEFDTLEEAIAKMKGLLTNGR